MTPAARVADAAVARERRPRRAARPARVAPAGDGRWSALLPDGGRATVAILPGAGFAQPGARARVVDGPPGCTPA